MATTLSPPGVSGSYLQTSRLVLTPHVYPTSVTGAVDEIGAAVETVTSRWDQSWGWKMQGTDVTMQVRR